MIKKMRRRRFMPFTEGFIMGLIMGVSIGIIVGVWIGLKIKERDLFAKTAGAVDSIIVEFQADAADYDKAIREIELMIDRVERELGFRPRSVAFRPAGASSSTLLSFEPIPRPSRGD